MLIGFHFSYKRFKLITYPTIKVKKILLCCIIQPYLITTLNKLQAEAVTFIYHQEKILLTAKVSREKSFNSGIISQPESFSITN